MKIGSISENKDLEKRVAVTPDIIKKYKSLGMDVQLTKDYALHLGINDKEYEREGANIFQSDDDVILNSDAILQMTIPDDEYLNKLRENQILVGVLSPHENEKN